MTSSLPPTWPPTWNNLAALAEQFAGLPPHRRLHVGSAIAAWMQTLPADHTTPSGISGALAGISVVVDPRMDAGQWQARTDDGEITDEGRIGQPGETADYLPGFGFVAFSLDALNLWDRP